MEDNKLIEKIIKITTKEVWDSWSKEQQQYILYHYNKPLKGIIKELNQKCGDKWSGNRNYSKKHWKFGKSRMIEKCSKCNFPFNFYAMPRDWSMRASADVWNLMKCANVECGHLYESCL